MSSEETPPRPRTLSMVAEDIIHTLVRYGLPSRARSRVGSGGGASKDKVNQASGGIGRSTAGARLKPNRHQRAWCKAVHEARRIGVSIQVIA